MTILSLSLPSSSSIDRRGVGDFHFTYDASIWRIFFVVLFYTFLNLLTFGIYRFWSKANLRRYFWSSVCLDGESFAYHGTGKELFLGFLVILPILFIYFGINYGVSLWFLDEELILSIYYVLLFIFSVFLVHFAIYRMVRYRLSRTSWCGVRLGMAGSDIGYGIKALIFTVLDFLSLYLLHPWIRARLLNYRIEQIYFGNRYFTSNLSGWHFCGAYYMSYIPFLAGLFVLVWLFIDVLVSGFIADVWGNDFEETLFEYVIVRGWELSIIFLFFIFSVLGYIRYRFAEACAIASSFRFCGLDFRCNFSFNVSALCYFLFLVLFLFGLFGLFLLFPLFRDLGIFYGYGLLGWLLLGIFFVYFYYYIFSVGLLSWAMGRIICGASVSGDLGILGEVRNLSVGSPRLGEGWFDALDIGNI